ncbi:hypothetical protein ZIOFF_017155 [Zingiber officinale]|uniref:ER membrane protein complex subunit 4 n=1 Tax=Zingiber officinale TaxID=94328 RepID=A0A8J5LI50_ZINOF|nr:hypothetical protein ZIOFF_017155 [Zingiber officinale]
MEKGKGVARRWAVEFADNSSYSSPSDIPDPLGFTRSSSDPVLPSDDANASRQKRLGRRSIIIRLCFSFPVVHVLICAICSPFSYEESLGSGSSPFQELVNDGVYDVDGWKYSSFIQYWYHLLGPLATNKCSSRSWKWLPMVNIQLSHIFYMNTVFLSSVFEPYKDPRVDTLAPKLLFIALNLAAMALGVWKLNSLGLLPTRIGLGFFTTYCSKTIAEARDRCGAVALGGE